MIAGDGFGQQAPESRTTGNPTNMTTTEWLRSRIGPAPLPAPPERVSRSTDSRTGFFTAYLRHDMRVLHAYCRDGKSTLSLATFVPMGEVTGVDPHSSNLRRARDRTFVADAGGISFERCTLQDLPFGPEEFDAALIDAALSTEGSPERALEEVKRVLAPGGLLGVRHTVASSRVLTSEVPLIERALRRRDSVAVDLGGDPDAGLKQPSMLRDAGFVNLRVTSSTEQKSDEELLAELSVEGFVPGLEMVEPEQAEDEQPVVLSFMTVVETVCWKPV